MIRIVTVILTLFAASLMVVPSASASMVKSEHWVSAGKAQSVIPLSQAVSAVRRAHPGSQVLSHRLVSSNSPYYVIRIVTRDGRRLDVRVDARNGRVIG